MYILSKGNCIAVGSLPRDAETYHVGAKETTKVSFSIKADEVEGADGKRQAVWMNCVAWGRLGRAYGGLEKGDTVLVAGKMREYSYTRKDGTEASGRELVCDFIQVLEYPGLCDDEGDGE